ncbi:MAG: biotin--[acetyl-CoA-carboxylase] ligase [Leptospirales bacterium]|nr:biotin--[acetyl-CoA-carboxylase] ligase [Leptospirales bacterium]
MKKDYILKLFQDNPDIVKNLNTRIIGKKDIFFFEETDSTNTQAFNFASKGADEGAIVIAECQTSGRGRLGREWISPAGKNLYLSIILRPEIAPHQAPGLTITAAVALSETLDEFKIFDHKIKWPNDILINDKKVSGILTEMKERGGKIDFIIIGLGVNINSTSGDYPAVMKDSVISLKEFTNSEINRIEFLQSFLANFEKNYFDFITGGFKEILNKWIEKSSIINRKICVTEHGNTFTGIVTEVTSDGTLIVKAGEKIHTINSGDINYIAES